MHHVRGNVADNVIPTCTLVPCTVRPSVQFSFITPRHSTDVSRSKISNSAFVSSFHPYLLMILSRYSPYSAMFIVQWKSALAKKKRITEIKVDTANDLSPLSVRLPTNTFRFFVKNVIYGRSAKALTMVVI